jgi:hypothetical protein
MVKIPRIRFSMRGMMVAVVVFALISLGGRETWSWWLGRGYQSQARGSRLLARLSSNLFVPGQPVPVSISYDFKFHSLTPPPGTSCLLLARVWLEDVKTGRAVSWYTFDAGLTAGGRETASGTFTWNAEVPHEGRYFLRFHLDEITPSGKAKFVSGQGAAVILTRKPETDPSGAKP